MFYRCQTVGLFKYSISNGSPRPLKFNISVFKNNIADIFRILYIHYKREKKLRESHEFQSERDSSIPKHSSCMHDAKIQNQSTMPLYRI